MTTVDMTTVDMAARRRVAGTAAPSHAGQPARRRSVPHLAMGALLIVTAALAGAVLQSRSDHRIQVLAVTRPVAAGQVLASADLRVVAIVSDPAVRTVTASHLPSILGRAAAVPLTAGSLLSPDQIGPPAWPPPGQAVVAVAVKAGHCPAGVINGARVLVIVAPQSGVGTATGGPARADATVVDVHQADQQGVSVVSVLTSDDAATLIGAASGEVSLVLRVRN